MNQKILLPALLIFSFCINTFAQTPEQQVQSRVNLFVAQEAEQIGELVTLKQLLETTERLSLDVKKLDRASSEEAKQEFFKVDLKKYFQNFLTIYPAQTRYPKATKALIALIPPLTDREIRTIEFDVTKNLDDVANTYNQKLDDFALILEDYYTFLSENPDEAEAIAFQINQGNYRSSSIMFESIQQIPTLREMIIDSMKFELIKIYEAYVDVPSGPSHYDAFLPHLEIPLENLEEK